MPQWRWVVPCLFLLFAFMIDRPPEIVLYTVDFDENLVEMPAAMPESAHGLNPISANFGAENWAEAIPPVADRLMGDVDAALMEQVLDVS